MKVEVTLVDTMDEIVDTFKFICAANTGIGLIWEMFIRNGVNKSPPHLTENLRFEKQKIAKMHELKKIAKNINNFKF